MKTLISSAPTIPELENNISEILQSTCIITGITVEINGEFDKSYIIERHGNRYNCYHNPVREGLEALKYERNTLMISGNNPKRLAEVKAKIDFIEYGITSNKK